MKILYRAAAAGLAFILRAALLLGGQRISESSRASITAVLGEYQSKK